VCRRLAVGLYAVGLILILLALARGNPALGTSVLVLAGTMGDVRVGRKGTSKISAKPREVRRTLPLVGWLVIVVGFVLLDIAALYGFALVTDVSFAQWIGINVVAVALCAVIWGEYRRLQGESARAREQQAQKERDTERRKREELQREARRQQEAERLRDAEQQREAERRRRQAEEEREAERQRQRQREQATTQSQTEWWSVLEVAPGASKDEIIRNYRRKIQQCHPDRVAGLAPEFLQLAEEHTKALNAAYTQAMRGRR
jgi:hypothetical protein